MSDKFLVMIGVMIVLVGVAVSSVTTCHRWMAQDGCEERGGRVIDREKDNWRCVSATPERSP